MEVKLYSLLNYSVVPFILISLILLIILIIILFQKKKTISKPKIITKTNTNIKNELLNDLNNISKENNKQTSYELSNILRKVVLYMYNINIYNYTKEEMKNTIDSEIYSIFEELYNSEFKPNYHLNINELINKTKEIINKWK